MSNRINSRPPGNSSILLGRFQTDQEHADCHFASQNPGFRDPASHQEVLTATIPREFGGSGRDNASAISEEAQQTDGNQP